MASDSWIYSQILFHVEVTNNTASENYNFNKQKISKLFVPFCEALLEAESRFRKK